MTAASRLRFLLCRLVANGVPPTDAKAWTVVPGAPGSHAKYTYYHPRVGQFHALTAAKDAHVALTTKLAARRQSHRGDTTPVRSPSYVGPENKALPTLNMRAGSRGAMAVLVRAPWHGGGADEYAPAVSPSVASKLDVVMVRADAGREVSGTAWHMRALEQDLGFTVIRRSSAVIDAGSGRVLALFLTGHEFGDVAALSLRLPDLYARLKGVMNPNRVRPGICMFGYRWNSQGHCNHACRPNMRTGYYPCGTLASARSLWRGDGGLTQDAVVGSAAAMCATERLVSPSMAARRAAHAEASGHPGIWPGTSHQTCAAPTLGVSQSYVSPPHVDHGFADMAETIAWSSKGVPQGSGYCFAVTDAGVVFDLLAHDGTMCIVPGSVTHGTPGLAPGFPSEHAGIGLVVLNKANLLSAEAKQDTQEVALRLTDTGNPFVQRFYVSDPDNVRCEACRRGDLAAELLLCDNCHRGYHRGCCLPGASSFSSKEWLCHGCAQL